MPFESWGERKTTRYSGCMFSPALPLNVRLRNLGCHSHPQGKSNLIYWLESVLTHMNITANMLATVEQGSPQHTTHNGSLAIIQEVRRAQTRGRKNSRTTEHIRLP